MSYERVWTFYWLSYASGGTIAAMKCPVCLDALLLDHQLETNLFSQRCPKCSGQWVNAKSYWAWRESQRPASLPQRADVALPTEQSHPRARLCPECGRLLRRARVGSGLDFFIDRCGHCGGIWF